MSWFAVGDSTDDHPKTLQAGNAALGLWVRCGAYASAYLTDGRVPGAVAARSGTGTQIRKLVASGLWHEAGHSCGSCSPVPAGDFQMHDYLEANPSRRQVLERRRRAAEKKRQQRLGGSLCEDPGETPDDSSRPPRASGGQLALVNIGRNSSRSSPRERGQQSRDHSTSGTVMVTRTDPIPVVTGRAKTAFARRVAPPERAAQVEP